MVDLPSRGQDGSSSSSGGSEGSGSGGSSSGGAGGGSADASAEPYSPSGEEMYEPDEMEFMDAAEKLSSDEGLNYDKTASTVDEYSKLQVEECREFYSGMKEELTDRTDDPGEFSLVLQAILKNMVQNRMGIYEVLTEEFGMSTEKAIRRTNSICKKAGEEDAFVAVTKDMFQTFVRA